MFIILFTEVVVSQLKAHASTTTKLVVEKPIFDGGSMVTAPPEIVTLEEETPMVENAVPPALFALNVILPVPLYTCWSKVIMILDATETPVAPILGLNVIGIGGTSSLVAVRTPTLRLGLPDKPVALPEPLPTKEVAVIIPEVLMLPVLPIPTPVSPEPLPKNDVAVTIPTLKFDGGEILVENPARLDALDILLFF